MQAYLQPYLKYQEILLEYMNFSFEKLEDKCKFLPKEIENLVQCLATQNSSSVNFFVQIIFPSVQSI